MVCSLSTTTTAPRSPAISAGILDNSANPADLLTDKAKTVPDLIALANALDAMIAIANAFTSTSRMQDAQHRGVLNEAGEELDEITDVLADRHVAVMGRLRDARPMTKKEAQARTCALIRWDLECDQDVTDMLVSTARKEMPDQF